jgi:hypothetical protein
MLACMLSTYLQRVLRAAESAASKAKWWDTHKAAYAVDGGAGHGLQVRCCSGLRGWVVVLPSMQLNVTVSLMTHSIHSREEGRVALACPAQATVASECCSACLMCNASVM